MQRGLLASATALLLMTVATGPAMGQDERRETVRFPGDSTVAEIPGQIRGYERVAYEVYAGEGQELKVSLRPDNRSANFNIYVPGRGFGDDALHMSERAGTEYEGGLWITGPHTIVVFLSRDAARRGETARYDLVVSLDKPEEASASRAAPSRAESDCLAAVAEAVGRGDLRVLSSEMGENSTKVLIEVPGAAAPWHCDWGYRDGSPAVLSVFYGDEG